MLEQDHLREILESAKNISSYSFATIIEDRDTGNICWIPTFANKPTSVDNSIFLEDKRGLPFYLDNLVDLFGCKAVFCTESIYEFLSRNSISWGRDYQTKELYIQRDGGYVTVYLFDQLP